jgi:D-alanine-D-alanine ligase
MSKKNFMKKIAIISGGISGEREISLLSATNLQEQIHFTQTELFIFPEDRELFFYKQKEIGCVIPLIHGVGGEDGILQGFLETMNIPYIFSGVEAHAIALDKKITNKLVGTSGIQIPEQYDFNHSENIHFPCIIKPRFGGSSLHVMVSRSDKLEKEKPHKDSEGYICESFIKGREFTVGIIESKRGEEALPVIEIKTDTEIFGWEQKYNPEKLAQEICPAEIDQELSQSLQQIALSVHKLLGIKHLSRSDFIVDEKRNIFFLEINTIPGMTKTSLIPKALQTIGYSLGDLIKFWIDTVKKN